MLADVVASLPDAVAITDRDGRIVFLNPAAEQLFAITDADARGQDAIALFAAPSEHERAHELLRRLVAGQPPVTGLHLCLRRADGSGFDADVAASALPAEAGIVLTARDITARLAAEADADALRALVGAAQEAIIGLDRHDLVEFFSPSAERLFGWTAAEMIGRPVSDLSGELRVHVFAAVVDSL